MSSSVTVHLGEDGEWPDPFSRSSVLLFKLFDPALQHRTRACGDCERANTPFDFCQLGLHNTCLNAVAPENTVTINGLGKSLYPFKKFIVVEEDLC